MKNLIVSPILIFKALHIIGFVAWFAGLFYLVRIFVYHAEAENRTEDERKVLQEQYLIMEQRVYKIICNPAMWVTWICGLAMIYLYGLSWLMENPWLQIKIFAVFLLTGYHHWCGSQIKKMAKGSKRISGYQFRLLNEVPTLFLFAIVFLATIKDLKHSGVLFIGLVVLGLLLFLGTRYYRKLRTHK